MKKPFLLTILISLFTLSASAQRMYNNQSSFQVNFGLNDGKNIATGIQYSMYKNIGQIVAGVEYINSNIKSNGIKVNYDDIIVNVGYLFKVITNYKHSIALSAGIAANAGYETIGSLPENITISAKNKFTYGVTPIISLDIFIAKSLAINGTIKEYINFNSDMSNYHFISTIGLKFLIN